jgi:hypothetical protein
MKNLKYYLQKNSEHTPWLDQPVIWENVNVMNIIDPFPIIISFETLCNEES